MRQVRQRPQRRVTWRWGVVAVLAAALAALPPLAGARSVADSDVSPDRLRALVRASAAVAWSGYGESTGSLLLPDVDELEELPALVGGTTRSRAWWAGPDAWRVDALSLVGETDVIRDVAGTTTWVSADRRAVRVDGRLDVRLPQPADLVAPVLGRRLAGAPDVVAERLPARRVAGVRTPGLRLVPRDPAGTTVARVDMWVDERTGLALRVDVLARGSTRPALSALLLDLDLGTPDPARTRFNVPADADYQGVDALDLAAQVDRFAPFVLPDALAGSPRSDVVDAFRDVAGVASYGTGLTAFAAVPLPRGLGQKVIDAVAEPGDEVAVIETPLVNVVVSRGQGRGRPGFLLAGTVPVAQLRIGLATLAAAPLPRVDG